MKKTIIAFRVRALAGRSTVAALAALAALAIPGSPRAAPRPPPPQVAGSPALSAVVAALRVSPQTSEIRARPALVDRLRHTPRDYFRFVTRPFTQAVCAQFDDVRGGFPDVNLHGDAHLEQYAVTSLGRGLTDFDESARGPSFVDLVRFGVSLELAAREKDWPGEGHRAFGAFLGGYREALRNPDIDSPAPPVVDRARAAFAGDHRLALRRADALMDADPVPASEIENDSRDYVTRMLADGAGMPSSFFDIKKAGRLTLGIGSALDEKYLFRIEGWSSEADDDQILEAKLVRPLSDVDCVRTEQGPERVPLGMALIANAPFAFSGLFTHRGRTFWVHAWTDDYIELSIDSSLASPQDLRQVAYDVGIQLGKAHPKEITGQGFHPGLRDILLQATRTNEARIRKTIDELAEATVRAWMFFREATSPKRSSKAARSRP
ncbi:MAG TPA: DUF2252 family protein [Vicinamibacterales bacterium]|nr:DUF2252 family protein [Vicinamibacterales bacterium]